MKIELSKEFESKLISFIITDDSSYKNICLITSLLSKYYKSKGSFGLYIPGIGCYPGNKIIAAFDNIKEAYAYYEYLIGK